MRFIISTESVNSYGFRVITAGIDLAGFLKNPVMLYMHDRYRYVAIGHWKDLRVEKVDGVGMALTGEPVFDEADDFAKTIKAKVDAGTLRACSPGLAPVEWSDDSSMLLAGQTRPTVTKSTLLEISIVDIPGNADAVKLSAPEVHFVEQGVTLSAGTATTNLDFFSLKQSQKMDKIALSLGLAATATQEEITAAIAKMKQDGATEKVQLALKLAREDGRVTDANEAKFLKLANMDLDMALDMFGKPEAPAAPAAGAAKGLTLNAAITNAQRQNAQVQGGAVVELTDKRKDWSIRDWEKKDEKGLLKLKRDQPDAYQELYDDFYGAKL